MRCGGRAGALSNGLLLHLGDADLHGNQPGSLPSVCAGGKHAGTGGRGCEGGHSLLEDAVDVSAEECDSAVPRRLSGYFEIVHHVGNHHSYL